MVNHLKFYLGPFITFESIQMTGTIPCTTWRLWASIPSKPMFPGTCMNRRRDSLSMKAFWIWKLSYSWLRIWGFMPLSAPLPISVQNGNGEACRPGCWRKTFGFAPLMRDFWPIWTTIMLTFCLSWPSVSWKMGAISSCSRWKMNMAPMGKKRPISRQSQTWCANMAWALPSLPRMVRGGPA